MGSIWLVTVGLVLAIGAWDLAGPRLQMILLVGVGMGGPVGAALRVAEDRMNGQMEFLVRLPTAPSNLVAARFMAVAAHALVWAVPFAVAVGWLRPEFPLAVGRAEMVLGAGLGFWAAASTLGWIFVAVFALFDLEALAGWRGTRLGHRHQSEPLIVARDPRGREYYWIGPPGPEQDAGPGTDFDAVANGFVSITPLAVDPTRHDALGALQEWMAECSSG